MLFRVSEVESFRQFRDDEEAELSDFLARMRNEVPPSQAMLAGTAFHDVLEHAQVGELATAEEQGFKFIIVVDTELALAPIRELRASKRYGGLTVSGKLDALCGLRVEDHKTTGRFDPDRYLAGYQWRFYLSIFGAQVFRWNVFEMREVEPMTYLVHKFHTLEQCRYPSMEADCLQLAIDLEQFARAHLPERENYQLEEAA
jgi:hypothetical protein